MRAVQLDPLGLRAVFLADALADETLELFSVPLDGSALPVRLNAPLVAGGDVGATRSFEITPDGGRVLYLADQRLDDVIELFAAPLDGSAAPWRLNAPLVAGGDVSSFRASPDARRVLYIADQEIDGVRELNTSFLAQPRRDAGPRRR